MLETNFLKKFIKARLNIDKKLYKKTKYDASKLITTKKTCILWKETLKSTGTPNKAVIFNFNAIEVSNILAHDTFSMSKTLKNFFSNLTESLLVKLPKTPDKYNLKSVTQYYSGFAITADFCLVSTTKKQV